MYQRERKCISKLSEVVLFWDVRKVLEIIIDDLFYEMMAQVVMDNRYDMIRNKIVPLVWFW